MNPTPQILDALRHAKDQRRPLQLGPDAVYIDPDVPGMTVAVLDAVRRASVQKMGERGNYDHHIMGSSGRVPYWCGFEENSGYNWIAEYSAMDRVTLAVQKRLVRGS